MIFFKINVSPAHTLFQVNLPTEDVEDVRMMMMKMMKDIPDYHYDAENPNNYYNYRLNYDLRDKSCCFRCVCF